MPQQHDAVVALAGELARLRRDYGTAGDALTVVDPLGPGTVEAALAGRTGLTALVGPQATASIPKEDVIHMLAALRDRHCRRIRMIIHQGDDGMAPLSRAELLALGFTGPVPGPAGDEIYLYDADEFNAPRDWNTPDDWAHPERFDKERW